MKKVFLILTMGIAMVSCSSDDDKSTKSDSEKILGKWKLTAFTSGFLDGQQSDEFNDCYSKHKLNFKSTSKVDITEVEYDSSIDICHDFEINDISYSILPDSQKLVISIFGSAPIVYNYEFLSDTSLKITYNEDGDFLYIYKFTKI